jgi:hypothetical protein
MSANSFGEIIQPIQCHVSTAADKTKLAMTFQSQDRTPFTVMLPVADAAGFQRNLAQTIYILMAKPPAPHAATTEPEISILQ